ncbi:kelch-like protein 24 isoform X2 [Ciona intestinalis]
MACSKLLSSNGHFDTIMNMLSKQQDSGRYCDVTLVAEGQNFPAHRAILAASSKYFDTMFNSQMKEEFEKVIEIKEVTKFAMEKVITFIYTNKFLFSEENINEVLYAASLMQVQDLLALVIQYLLDEISPINCLHYRQLGKLYSLNDLVTECDRCICDNFDQVSTQEKFFETDEEEMEKFVSSGELVELVLEFLDCRYLVDDAIYFYVKPDLFEKQKPRKGHYPCKELIFVPNKKQNIACYNMKERKWSSLQDVGEPEQSVMFIVHEEKVYCFDYFHVNLHLKANVSKCFNGIQWENLARMINYHSDAAVASIQGEIFIFGGLSHMNRNYIYFANTISKYNPNNNTWLKVGPAKLFRTEATAVGVGNVAYICGGYEQVNDHERNTTTVCAKVEMYDTVNNTWEEGKNMKKGRASCAAVHFDGKIFAFGGFGSNNTLLSSGEFMNIADGVWTMLTNNIPFQLGKVSACCVGDHIAMYGSSKPGHIALYNTNNKEWRTFKEEAQNLFNGRGCLMAK